MGIIFNGIVCLQMVKNLDWFIFSPDSLRYKLKLENVAKAFTSIGLCLFDRLRLCLSQLEANRTVMCIKLIFNLESPT